jgi:hypothetical protein
MWYYRLFIIAIIILAAIYYIMVALQCFGILSMTKREINFMKAIIPFYYWIKG